jgi:hypothetical protein
VTIEVADFTSRWHNQAGVRPLGGRRSFPKKRKRVRGFYGYDEQKYYRNNSCMPWACACISYDAKDYYHSPWFLSYYIGD